MKYTISFLCLIWSFNTQAQNYTYDKESLFEIETKGVIESNRPSDNTEFFGQTRTALIGYSLRERSQVQAGLSVFRVGNEELLELPLFYRFQVNESLSAYGGAQVQLSRGVFSSSLPATYRETSATFGVDYEINDMWDAGIQFVIPVDENANLPATNFNFSQPIRLRTGIKF